MTWTGRLTVIVVFLAAFSGRAGGWAQDRPGDLQVGDRILLEVEGEPQLSDTFAVGPGLTLTLPVVGEIALAGVRRGELESYLTQQLARYLKDPVVRARALLRISILGEVERPGFYAVRADAVLADALMMAGGPTRDAKFDALRIERGETRIWDGKPLQEAIARGLTLEKMNLRTGDHVLVPRRGGRGLEGTVRVLGILVTIPAAIYGASRIF